MFRRSAADLQGASVRVHITLITGSDPVKNLAEQMDSDHQEELSLEDSEETDQVPMPSKSSRTVPDITAVLHTETDRGDSFPVSVVVDRAMHLSLKSLSKSLSPYLNHTIIEYVFNWYAPLLGCPLAERSESSPCCYVSYVTADASKAVSTAVAASTDCPVWNHHHQCRWSLKALFTNINNIIVSLCCCRIFTLHTAHQLIDT